MLTMLRHNMIVLRRRSLLLVTIVKRLNRDRSQRQPAAENDEDQHEPARPAKEIIIVHFYSFGSPYFFRTQANAISEIKSQTALPIIPTPTAIASDGQIPCPQNSRAPTETRKPVEADETSCPATERRDIFRPLRSSQPNPATAASKLPAP